MIIEKRAAQIRRKAQVVKEDKNSATESDAGAFEFEWREGGSE